MFIQTQSNGADERDDLKDGGSTMSVATYRWQRHRPRGVRWFRVAINPGLKITHVELVAP